MSGLEASHGSADDLMAYDDDASSRFTTAVDGLRLHYRDLGSPGASGLPVVCLPGLTRTSEDFDVVAEALAAGRDGPGLGRRVLALDYRGRGGSDRDPNPDNYNVGVECRDVLTVLAAAGIGEAVFLGTSRGGLITIALGTRHPEMIRGAILNDIGPVLEPAGLERIRGYVGKRPPPSDWDDAVAIIQSYAGPHFIGLSADEWMAFARTTYEERDGAIRGRYDPALMNGLAALDVRALPSLWKEFAGLFHAPLLVIRGHHTDLLSEATAAEMIRRHPDATCLTVPGQGHAPLLRDRDTVERILRFADHCDTVRHAVPVPGPTAA